MMWIFVCAETFFQPASQSFMDINELCVSPASIWPSPDFWDS